MKPWIGFCLLLFFVYGNAVSEQLGRRVAVPVVYLRGSHYDVGFDTGRIFASMIKEYLANYGNLHDYEREYKTEAGREVYEKTLSNMKQRFPQYIKEMEGVAKGADVPFYKLFLLQMDDLIGTVNDNHIPRDDTGGCSSIGVMNPDSHVLGHTEDAFAETLNHFYIVSAHIIPTPEDRENGAREERFASLCYAGNLPGYTSGYNEHGLVFSINTLSPLVLKYGNTPRTFLTRALLAAKNFNDAERILLDKGLGSGNGFSVNMIWTDPWGSRQLYNVEVAPDLKADKSLVNIRKYNEEPLVHCNIYERINVTEVNGPIIESSHARLKTIHSYPPPQTRSDVENIISDTSGKEFQVFQNRPDTVIKTINAGIFDLDDKTWNIYINKPNSTEPVAVLPIKFNI